MEAQTQSEISMKIRILLVDDHTILRAGLKMMLNAQPDMDVIGEAQDGRQAIQESQRLHPDIILMDITMPDMNGIEATRQIKKVLPDVRVLVLTMHENDEYVFQALRAGASGYILKEAADTELISALHVVQNGNFYLSPSAQSVMVGDYLQRVNAGEEKLRTDQFGAAVGARAGHPGLAFPDLVAACRQRRRPLSTQDPAFAGPDYRRHHLCDHGAAHCNRP